MTEQAKDLLRELFWLARLVVSFIVVVTFLRGLRDCKQPVPPDEARPLKGRPRENSLVQAARVVKDVLRNHIKRASEKPCFLR